ncbi:hypothetical protein ACMXYR_16370 [Neptuniibacter sp. QD29_5]|uniref:hypothetical protein n=1 Tax=Neptuniibacter sp. QD29_5 TaxID=3398207 RepID=UPI0039F48F22
MFDNKYTACGKCLKSAVEIQLGVSEKNWSDLGKVGPLCTPCLQSILEHFNATSEEKQIKVKTVS